VREARFETVRRRVAELAPHDVHAKEWLKWPIRRRFATLPRLGKTVMKLLLAESYLFLFKRLRLVLTSRASVR
jgi:hypothetical protein